MIRRCENRNVPEYKLYGARGIKVCPRWRHGDGALSGYECFLADLGRRPGKEWSIDRIDSDGNYEPSNCRWLTIEENGRRGARKRWDARAA